MTARTCSSGSSADVLLVLHSLSRRLHPLRCGGGPSPAPRQPSYGRDGAVPGAGDPAASSAVAHGTTARVPQKIDATVDLSETPVWWWWWCQGPKKSTPHPSCQDRQLELVAAATQRRPPPQNCTCGPCNCTTASTTKCTATGEIPVISRKWEKPLRHDREANATSRCGPQGPSPSSRRNSVKIPSRCRLTQCMYPLLNQAWR